MAEESFKSERAWGFIHRGRKKTGEAHTERPAPQETVAAPTPREHEPDLRSTQPAASEMEPHSTTSAEVNNAAANEPRVEPTVREEPQYEAPAKEEYFTRGAANDEESSTPENENPTERRFRINTLEAAMGAAREATVGVGENARKIRIKIPPQTKNGTVLRIHHQEVTYNFTVEVTSHPIAALQGNNIVVRMPITLREAIDGVTLEVPTLEGQRTIRLPRGWTPAHLITIRGAGLKDLGADEVRGDLLVQPYIVPPDTVTNAVLEAVKVIEGHYLRPAREGLALTLLDD